MLVRAQVAASSQGPPLPFRVGLPFSTRPPDNPSSTCPFVFMVILKRIKLTFKSNDHRSRATVESGWPGLLPGNILLPSFPCRVMSTVKHTDVPGMSALWSCPAHSCPWLQQLSKQLGEVPVLSLGTFCLYSVGGHPCGVPPRLAESRVE